VRITWSRRAHRELDAVLAFIAQDNPQAAEEIIEKIMAAVTMLAKFPRMGKQTVDPRFQSLAVAGTHMSSTIAPYRERHEGRWRSGQNRPAVVDYGQAGPIAAGSGTNQGLSFQRGNGCPGFGK
jgi:plasmid stabilization system protein ParE